jgi:hypothetical protein
LKSPETPGDDIVYNGQMTDTQKLENSVITKFCCNLGMTPTKTFEKKQQANRENKILLSYVFKWHTHLVMDITFEAVLVIDCVTLKHK